MTNTKKPRFKHVAINGRSAKTGTKYAKDLADAMNSLVEQGYSVQLSELENFTVVMGVLESSAEQEEVGAEHPLMRFMRAQLEAPTMSAAKAVVLGPRTRELVDRFERLPGFERNVETYIAEVKKNAKHCAAGFRAEELTVAVKELDALRGVHETHGGCVLAQVLQVITDALRGVVHTQLA